MKYFIFFLLSIFIFSACNNTEKNSSIKVFHYNQPNKITSLDPAFAKSQNNIWAINHMYNTLVQLDSSMILQACIAKKWEISDDGLAYTFHLRNDVLFHNCEAFGSEESRKLTAYDVSYSFARIISTELNSPGSWIFLGKIAENMPFEAKNDSTFILHLKAPFLPMLNILSMQYCSVVSRRANEFYVDNLRENPIGTGPFQFKRWIENQGLYLIRNPDYFETIDGDKLPFLDGVRTSFIEDKKIAFLELLNQKVEYVSGLESSFINEMLDEKGELRDDKKDIINLYKSPFLNFEYLGFNLEKIGNFHPLKDKRIRQALNFAIDRETMLISLRNNIGKPADSGVIPIGLPSYDNNEVPGYSYNLDKAKNLLVEAGFPNGEGIPELSINTNQDYLDISTFVAKQWEKLGLNIRINLLESAALREGMRKGTMDIFRASWIADYPDGENFLCLFYSKNGTPPRYTRFSNEKFDMLYERSIKETDIKARTDMYHQMNRIIVEEAPVVFLFYDESAVFTLKNIQKFERNAVNLLQVKQLKEY